MIDHGSTGESVALGGGTVVVVAVTVLGASASDNTGPILAFVGAVLVALIAAFTAHRRLGRTLVAEAERQQRALTAESERLARQLEHDREMADLADVRSALNDAAQTLHQVTAFTVHQARHVNRDEVEAVRSGQRDLSAQMTRLVLLLGVGHPATKRFRRCTALLGDWRKHASAFLMHDPESNDFRDGEAAKIDEVFAEFTDALGEFLTAAENTARAELPPSPSK